jgi:Uncharacterized protein conserved in bacteria (DUF2252)
MNTIESTKKYENWLSQFFAPVAPDLHRKHEQMREDSFTFLRATFYRWAQNWRQLPSAIRRAPDVLAVGDAHVENFGTWRDGEGRLVWGVNDFDEAATIPYTSDLARLATSAGLARLEGKLTLSAHRICPAILRGYADALRRGGRAIVLDSGPRWLRNLVQSESRDDEAYWEKLLALPAWRGAIPRRARTLLGAVEPPARRLRFVHRVSGVGSLGRPRFAALYVSTGGLAAREVKARAPSAWHWARGESVAPEQNVLPRIWRRAIRSQDPYLHAAKRWIHRRLAADCSRIDLDAIPMRRRESDVLTAMGWELANIHLGSISARALREHLETLDANWLPEAAAQMAEATQRDFAAWTQKKVPETSEHA